MGGGPSKQANDVYLYSTEINQWIKGALYPGACRGTVHQKRLAVCIRVDFWGSLDRTSPNVTDTPHHWHWLTELRYYVALHTKIGHFGDVLTSQSLGLVLKKLNLTQQKQTTQEQNSLSWTRKTHKMPNLNKHMKTKRSKPKPTHIVKHVIWTGRMPWIVVDGRSW